MNISWPRLDAAIQFPPWRADSPLPVAHVRFFGSPRRWDHSEIDPILAQGVCRWLLPARRPVDLCHVVRLIFFSRTYGSPFLQAYQLLPTPSIELNARVRAALAGAAGSHDREADSYKGRSY